MTTQQLIASMLTENTGTHMLDSGGDSGRAWQRTRKELGIDHNNKLNKSELNKAVEYFEDQPSDYVDYYESDLKKKYINSDDLIANKSTYHHLTEVLTTDSLCDEFNQMPVDDWGGEYYGVSESGQEWLDERFTFCWSDNSYNGESSLDRTIQVTGLAIEGMSTEQPEYYLVQVHGGADVRGGYTDAKLFRIDQWAEWLDFNPTVWLTIGGHELETSYNGYSLTNEGGEPVKLLSKDVKEFAK